MAQRENAFPLSLFIHLPLCYLYVASKISYCQTLVYTRLRTQGYSKWLVCHCDSISMSTRTHSRNGLPIRVDNTAQTKIQQKVDHRRSVGTIDQGFASQAVIVAVLAFYAYISHLCCAITCVIASYPWRSDSDRHAIHIAAQQRCIGGNG